jgi:hypothetical protein
LIQDIVGELTIPPITLPTNIMGLLPAEATCIIEPTVKDIAPSANAIRRPSLSPSGAAARAPKKHPA